MRHFHQTEVRQPDVFAPASNTEDFSPKQDPTTAQLSFDFIDRGRAEDGGRAIGVSEAIDISLGDIEHHSICRREIYAP
jgi:hypothetical protein